MKNKRKFLVMLMLFIASISFAENVVLLAINARSCNGKWEGWVACNIDAKIQLSSHYVEIYSKVPQKFKLKQKLQSKGTPDKLFLAKDSKGREALIMFSRYNTLLGLMTITYPQGSYMYLYR
jgi:hypothetical protein